MARKDSEKDSERPHYYSQFWLDVAAGRRVIGAPKEGDQSENDLPEPPAPRRSERVTSSAYEDIDSTPASSNGRVETIEHPIVEPQVEEEELIGTASEEVPLEVPLLEEEEYQDAELEDTDIPDMDLSPVVEEEEEDFFEEDEGEEEEEEEDDLGWSGRGRKKPKPGRQVKQPVRKPKRDTRRGF